VVISLALDEVLRNTRKPCALHQLYDEHSRTMFRAPPSAGDIDRPPQFAGDRICAVHIRSRP